MLEKWGVKRLFQFHESRFQRETLIAIVTCKKNALRAQACKDTWVLEARIAGYNVEFFDGERLGVPDDYLSLPLKTKALCGWALGHGYNRILKCDDDTYIRVDRLWHMDDDYAGIVNLANDTGCPGLGIPDFPEGTIKFSYAKGGCYWLSKRSMSIIANSPSNGDWAEDRWVGQMLGEAGIHPMALPNFIMYSYPSFSLNCGVIMQITEPEDILRCHNGSFGEFPKPPIKNPLAPISNWQRNILEVKVNRAVAKEFEVVAAVVAKSGYHGELCRIFPNHIEEMIDASEGKKVLFLVK